MTGPFGRFDPSELEMPGEEASSVAELADALAAARELEALAASDGIRPTEGFDDRIMAAIAMEPVARPLVSAGNAVRDRRPAAFLLAVRDAWRVAASGGRPLAARAQALAFVLIVVVGAGGLTAGGAMTVGGFLQHNNGPTPPAEPGPEATPTPTPPTVKREPPATPDPAETPEASETPEPSETAEPTETAKPRPPRTPRPTETARPDKTPEPPETPEPTDEHGGSGSG